MDPGRRNFEPGEYCVKTLPQGLVGVGPQSFVLLQAVESKLDDCHQVLWLDFCRLVFRCSAPCLGLINLQEDVALGKHGVLREYDVLLEGLSASLVTDP